jgi:hypothetical protein
MSGPKALAREKLWQSTVRAKTDASQHQSARAPLLQHKELELARLYEPSSPTGSAALQLCASCGPCLCRPGWRQDSPVGFHIVAIPRSREVRPPPPWPTGHGTMTATAPWPSPCGSMQHIWPPAGLLLRSTAPRARPHRARAVLLRPPPQLRDTALHALARYTAQPPLPLHHTPHCVAPSRPPLLSSQVGQSYLTSIGTTLYSLAFAFALVLRERPELVRAAPNPHARGMARATAGAPGAHSSSTQFFYTVLLQLEHLALTVLRPQVLVNGPGTCIPICAAAFAFRCASRAVATRAAGAWGVRLVGRALSTVRPAAHGRPHAPLPSIGFSLTHADPSTSKHHHCPRPASQG